MAASHFGLSAAVAVGGTSKDTWKGAWKFEIDRQDQPALSYYTPEASPSSASAAGHISTCARIAIRSFNNASNFTARDDALAPQLGEIRRNPPRRDPQR